MIKLLLATLHIMTATIHIFFYIDKTFLGIVNSSNDEQLQKSYFAFIKKHQMKTLRWQTVSACLIILSSIGYVWYNVNNVHGTYGYHTNIFHNHEFNVFCVVLLVMGLMSTIFLKNADTFEMCNIKKKCGAFSKSLVTIFFILLIVR